MEGEAPLSWTGYSSLENEPKVYTLMIDKKKYNLLDFQHRLTKGPFNFKTISVRHPDELNITFYRFTPTDTDWYLDVSNPQAAYGLTHSFATEAYEIPIENLSDLWEIIKGYFPGIEQGLHNARRNRNLRVELAEKYVQNRGGPEELGVEIASFIEGPRPKGWADAKRNLQRINTTLFTNKGGKRKQRRKTRKQRK